MTIKLTLQDYQVKGIKKYLKEICEIEKPTKADIIKELQNRLESEMQAPSESLADYVEAERLKQ
jgi:hypothetical protein